MRIYYNDNDPFNAAWLRNLIDAGLLPAGDVDDRSIEDVEPDDLRGYEQAHFFCGIGGWPYALLLAGWEGPVWTGSCPCQPISSAGKKRADADERHLWPAFHHLIAECSPPTVFGEQVAGPLGREWMSAVRTDLEDLGYAIGVADLPAASVGAPHERQRLWWVADSEINGWHRWCARMEESRWAPDQSPGSSRVDIGSMDNTMCDRSHIRAECGDLGSDCTRATIERYGNVGDTNCEGLEGQSGYKLGEDPIAPQKRLVAKAGLWDRVEWLPCKDGRTRPAQPGVFPMANGVPGRVGRLRAYGNAIVPQVAAEFIAAFMEVEGGQGV